MKKIKIFYKEESPYHLGKYHIVMNHEAFCCEKAKGSFNLIQARLCGLTYPQYLRMCRDCLGAEIVGKGSIYPVAYFKRSKELDSLIDFLNVRANLILWEREHPDYEAHAEKVRNENPEFYKAVTANE